MQNIPDKESLVNFLSKVSLFNKADQAVLFHLAERTNVSYYAGNQTIIRKGDVGDAMFLILEGRLKVHDEEHQVAELGKGELFGELSLLDREPRSMSVSTLEEAMLGSISRNDFFNVLQKSPGMLQEIIAVLNKRLRNQNDKLIGEYRSREDQLKELVRIRTEELAQRNTELQLALDDLKKSQQQLIQTEKLASLGQLTSGIAHEIKNPLNFINNFSSLSRELLQDIETSTDEDERQELLTDIKLNLSKIEHHGKRADGIIKSMLEHSRNNSGEKTLTDINQLCDKYLSIAYSNKLVSVPEFDSAIEKKFTANLPKLNVFESDIGRVFLSLFNNAFYAVHEKNKTAVNYRPNVCVETLLQTGKVIIRVSDNGTGISEKIIDKIFNPFFTTKPTGEGVGMGLSLGFDIVKAHNGELNVESKEKEFTIFTIVLPS